MHIAFTLREHNLVISEISIQQRHDPVSEESDLTLEEMKGDQLERTCVSFFKGLSSGYSKELLNDVRALYNIRWRICSGAIKRQESCAVKGKYACCSKGKVFLKQHCRVVKV